MTIKLERHPEYTALAEEAVNAIHAEGGVISFYDFQEVTGFCGSRCDIAVRVLLDNGLAIHYPKTGLFALTEKADHEKADHEKAGAA